MEKIRGLTTKEITDFITENPYSTTSDLQKHFCKKLSNISRVFFNKLPDVLSVCKNENKVRPAFSFVMKDQATILDRIVNMIFRDYPSVYTLDEIIDFIISNGGLVKTKKSVIEILKNTGVVSIFFEGQVVRFIPITMIKDYTRRINRGQI